MKDYGRVRSTVSPKPMVIDEFSVWIHSNVTPVEEDNGEETFVGFEYDVVQYDKDEYIKIITEKNQNIETQLTEVQLAIVELYEGRVV